MTKSLPGKKGLWGHIRDGLHDMFWVGSRGARINAEAQERNNQNLIEYYDKRDNIQQQMEIAKIQLQVVTQQRTLEVQVEQGNRNPI